MGFNPSLSGQVNTTKALMYTLATSEEKEGAQMKGAGSSEEA